MGCKEAIIESADGQRIYLQQGYGGESQICGGCYRWRHGLAMEVLPGDTLTSLHTPDDMGNSPIMWATHGDAFEGRRILDWDGNVIQAVAGAVGL
jgi:hypothetical protein